MWPFERRHDVLRIGRARVELWSSTAHGMVLRDHELIASRSFDTTAVKAAVSELLMRFQPGKLATIDMVLESACLPVMPIESGPMLLSPVQIEALLRHRVSQIYGPTDELGTPWAVMVDHRAGDRFGVGFALSPALRSALLDAAQTSKCKVASVQPALAWGRRRRSGIAARESWLLWGEQDRTLVALIRGGRIYALNAAGPMISTSEQAVHIACIEALRQGIAEKVAPVFVASWHETVSTTDRASALGVSWIPLAAPATMEGQSAVARLAGLERGV